MYKEAKKLFTTTNNISGIKVLHDRFVLVLDFRSVSDNNVFNIGLAVDGGSGIQIRLKKKATTKDVKCLIYILSDALIDVMSDDLQRLTL